MLATPSFHFFEKEPSRWQDLLIGGRHFALFAGARSVTIFGVVRNLTHSNTRQYARVVWVDTLRGVAVAGMVCYHFLYDLRIFFPGYGISETSPFWRVGHLVIAGSFFLISGIACGLATKNAVPLPRVLLRISVIAIYALVVSLSTLILLPNKWIYFGILHALVSCALISLPLRHYPRLCGILALLCSVGYAVSGVEIPNRIGGVSSLDYVPIFPWIAVYLAGIFLCKFIDPYEEFPRIRDSLPGGILTWMGGRALMIYVLHQPILLGLLWAASRL